MEVGDHPHDSEDHHEEGRFVDDLTGNALDKEKVQQARREYLDFIFAKPFFRVVDEEACWRVKGKAPINTSWVDIDKGGLP